MEQLRLYQIRLITHKYRRGNPPVVAPVGLGAEGHRPYRYCDCLTGLDIIADRLLLRAES